MNRITTEQFNDIAFLLAKGALQKQFNKNFSILKDGATEAKGKPTLWGIPEDGKAAWERSSDSNIEYNNDYNKPLSGYDALMGGESYTFKDLDSHEKIAAIIIIGAGLLYSLNALKISINDPQKIEKVRANLIESFNRVDDFFKLKASTSIKKIKDKYKEDYESLKVDRDVYINSISIKQLKDLSKHLSSFNNNVKKDLLKSIKGNVSNDERKRLIKYFETKI